MRVMSELNYCNEAYGPLIASNLGWTTFLPLMF